MEKLNEQIMSAIEKNMPAQVGAVLKGQLEELEALREYKENAEKKFAENSKELGLLQEKVATNGSLAEKTRILMSETEKFKQEKHEFAIEKLKHELSLEQKYSGKVEGFVNSLLRNSIMRKKITGFDGPVAKELETEEEVG